MVNLNIILLKKYECNSKLNNLNYTESVISTLRKYFYYYSNFNNKTKYYYNINLVISTINSVLVG